MSSISDRSLRVAMTGVVSDDDPHIIADMMCRIEELEQALKEIRALAKFEQQQDTGLAMTCFSLIERKATLALAGCDTYEMETEG